MDIKEFVFNGFSENTFVVYDDSKECIIIDPGCYEKEEREQLVSFVRDNQLTVVKLINTHCHIDHVLGNAFIKHKYDVALTIHQKDLPTLKANEVVAPFYGIQNYEQTEAEEFIDEGDKVQFGNSELDVLFVPGHAPGHIALIDHAGKRCISGDVLFHQSIGRTDLPGGDYDTLIGSIKGKLFSLPDEYKVFCGHGSSTVIGFEKQYNPFCGLNVIQ